MLALTAVITITSWALVIDAYGDSKDNKICVRLVNRNIVHVDRIELTDNGNMVFYDESNWKIDINNKDVTTIFYKKL